MEDKKGIILNGLNPEQREAVENIHGPMLVVAGAGSGKTRVLTSRVAFILASEEVTPSRILALTFTKKAAGEMKERIRSLVGDAPARGVVMGTFHSIFVRFLREFAPLLGYPQNFTIYDQSDSLSACKACIKELELDDKKYKPKEVQSRISLVKNALFTPEAYRRNADFANADTAVGRGRLWEVFALYQKKLKQSGVMDFDDILLQTNILFRDFPDALGAIASRFSYILVDEYQDTNYAQYLILKKLAAPHHNICVVGDDSQSIYAFRGAKIENILNFRKDYPESRIVRLERNYRSTANIVDAANSLISHNEGRIPKKCYSVGERGEKLNFIRAGSEQEEALMIVGDILSRMRRDSARYKDFAILYRTNAQSRALEEQLRRRNIPYMIYSGHSFFERAEIKDLMAYFKLIVNQGDDESFKRAVNQPARGIGETTMAALGACARANGVPLFKAAFLPDSASFGVRPAAASKIQEFCRLIEGFAAKEKTAEADEFASEIADGSGLYRFYKEDSSIEGKARVANIEELISAVASFCEERRNEFADNGIPESEFPRIGIADFLEGTALLANVDVSDNEEDAGNKTALMTVHSAKGLEFPYVYVAGCEENLFPSGGLLASKQDIEEERRLFYVALTRAGRALTISFADNRMRNGRRDSNQPSRFVREIDPSLVANPLIEDFAPSAFGSFGSAFARKSSFSGFSRGARGGFSGGFKGGFANGAEGGFKPSPEERPKPSSAQVFAAKPPIIDADFVPVPMEELYEGETIEHNRFGAGKIISLSGTAPDMKATVVFDDYGEKRLLLKYAKLRPKK